jgi:hypothetical protein
MLVRMKGFARREFQLMLLRRMADFQPELVSAACEEVGATHAQYMAAHNRWQSMIRSSRAPRGLRLYAATLGPPEDEQEMRFGDVTVTQCCWRLPGIWPDLRWQVTVGTQDVVLHGWLVRAGGSEVPQLPEPARLAPWSCVVGDVMTRYPSACQRDPDIPSQWLVTLAGHELWFVHGLLQTVRPARVTANVKMDDAR